MECVFRIIYILVHTLHSIYLQMKRIRIYARICKVCASLLLNRRVNMLTFRFGIQPNQIRSKPNDDNHVHLLHWSDLNECTVIFAAFDSTHLFLCFNLAYPPYQCKNWMHCTIMCIQQPRESSMNVISTTTLYMYIKQSYRFSNTCYHHFTTV